MSNVMGVGGGAGAPLGQPEVNQIPFPTLGAAGPTPAMPLPTGSAMPSVSQITSFLLSVAQTLAINPVQLGAALVRGPEAVAEVFDSVGAPSPAAAEAPVVQDPLGEALIGSQPKDYAYDPLTEGPLPNGQTSPSAAYGLDLTTPAGDATPPTVETAPMGAPAPPGQDLAALLSGVRPPDTPAAPLPATPSAPRPNAMQTTGMDEIIRAALAVGKPQAANLTLSGLLGGR